MALLGDPSSRLHAAVERWDMPLPEWVAMRQLMVTYGAAGVESIDWPWTQEQPPTDDEVETARRWHDAHSAIPD